MKIFIPLIFLVTISGLSFAQTKVFYLQKECKAKPCLTQSQVSKYTPSDPASLSCSWMIPPDPKDYQPGVLNPISVVNYQTSEGPIQVASAACGSAPAGTIKINGMITCASGNFNLLPTNPDTWAYCWYANTYYDNVKIVNVAPLK